MNRQICIETEHEQWRINLKELRTRTGISYKQIADKNNLSEKSVARVFTGEAKSPSVDLVRRIIHALGGTWGEIFAESGAVIGGQDLATLQAEVETIKAERDLVIAENAILKDKVSTLTTENDMLKLENLHKSEIIAIHNYYNSLRTK